MIALVASVVPWMITPMFCGERLTSAIAASMPLMHASTGFSGVVSSLQVARLSPASSATSVNVPPISTPMRPKVFPPPIFDIVSPESTLIVPACHARRRQSSVEGSHVTNSGNAVMRTMPTSSRTKNGTAETATRPMLSPVRP